MRTKTLAAAQGILAAAFLMAGGYSLSASDLQSQASRPDVVVLINPLQKQDDAFRDVIAGAAQYKLQRLGLRSEVISASAAEAKKPQPQARGAAAALVCQYGVQGQQMDVTLGWYDAKSDSSSAVVETKGDVDLNLDNVILAALDQMLAKVHDKIRVISDSRPPDATPVSQTATNTGTPPGVVVVTPASREQPTGPTRRFLFSGGFAPFLPAGAAAYYFSLGYLPSLLASVFIDTPVGPIGLGLYAGMDYFTATGSQDTASTFLLPFGVDVRYELGRATFRPFFHVAGGPAALIMVTGAQGTITSLVPFLKSGIGLDLLVTQTIGISVLADYDVYFVLPYLLTGFAPSMNVEFRL
ncbi:MAG TPA: hypothetical protein VL354_22090 [Spirochaetia bacterium]|nr:hypothetical protein [Spirochaetia bacterium]